MRWQRYAVAVAALTTLTACGSTGTPQSAGGPTGGAAATGAATSAPAPLGGADVKETCAAIKAVRLTLVKEFLEFAGRAEGATGAERETLAKDLVKALDGAASDLERAAAGSGDAALKDAATGFASAVADQASAVKAAGSDVDKIMTMAQNTKTTDAEKTIITTCLDV